MSALGAGPEGFEPSTFGYPLFVRGPTLLSVLSYGPRRLLN